MLFRRAFGFRGVRPHRRLKSTRFVVSVKADAERRAFLEICDERYQTRATLLTSQLPVAKWHGQIGDPTVADSIMDRLVHAAHRLELEGESIRKTRAGRSQKDGK